MFTPKSESFPNLNRKVPHNPLALTSFMLISGTPVRQFLAPKCLVVVPTNTASVRAYSTGVNQ